MIQRRVVSQKQTPHPLGPHLMATHPEPRVPITGAWPGPDH
jgi:hypothetical protein